MLYVIVPGHQQPQHWQVPFSVSSCLKDLTHWGRVTHICVSKLTTIGSDNGLSPGWRQAIIWTNAGILLIGTLRTNFSEIVCEIHTFSFTKMHFKMSFGTWQPFCLGLNVLTLVVPEISQDHLSHCDKCPLITICTLEIIRGKRKWFSVSTVSADG